MLLKHFEAATWAKRHLGRGAVFCVCQLRESNCLCFSPAQGPCFSLSLLFLFKIASSLGQRTSFTFLFYLLVDFLLKSHLLLLVIIHCFEQKYWLVGYPVKKQNSGSQTFWFLQPFPFLIIALESPRTWSSDIEKHCNKTLLCFECLNLRCF